MTTSIDIDIGGTFTEAVVSRAGAVKWGKVSTTPYNLSLGAVNAIFEASRQLQTDVKTLFEDTRIIRYSTTLALNDLIQRKGARLGLLTTAGLEDLILIGRSKQWGDGLPRHIQRKTGAAVNPLPLVSEGAIIGIRERTDSMGNILAKPSRTEVIESLRQLIAKGARGIVISFLWSFMNPTNEKYVARVIEEELPEAYLGSVPVFLSSEVQPKWLEYPRTMLTVLNAYLHMQMGEQLNELGAQVRTMGYRKPLMLVHNTGGTAKLSRTKVTDTYNGGPVAGMVGSLKIGRLYGLKNIVTAEMGGTTFNMGVISEGALGNYESNPVIDRWAVNSTYIENRSIGAGGGSIAWFNEGMGGRLEVGPGSAGSNPGPVCYDLGGREPTVTDADLLLGYLNDKFFLGGRIRLNKNKARRVVKEKVADRLGVSVEEAALAMKTVIDEKMGAEIATDISLKGYDPREFAMFSFGGAGPVHCFGVNKQVRARVIYCFRFGAVFDALGASFLDVRHIYERSVGITLSSSQDHSDPSYRAAAETFNHAVDSMQEVAFRDVASEGLNSDKIVISLELDMRYETQLMVARITSPVSRVSAPADVSTIVQEFKSQLLKSAGISFPHAVVRIESIRLLAEAPTESGMAFTGHESMSSDASGALKDKRDVFWAKRGLVQTPIFDLNRLKPGNSIDGPVVVEGEDTTIVVPEEGRISVDKFDNFVVEEVR